MLLYALECRHFGIHPSQLLDALRCDFFTLPAAAAGADIADDTHVTADGVTVNRVVDGAVAYTAVMHVADNGFKGFHVVGSIAIQFHIADVTCVAQSVIGAFQTNLIVHGDGIPDRDMERVV